MFSFYLPYVFPNVDTQFIINVCQYKHNIGNVSHVDIVSKQSTHNTAYVHFESINSHLSHVRRLFERLNNGETCTLNYQGKYYWNILKDLSKGKLVSKSERKNRLNICSPEATSYTMTMKDNRFFSNLVNQNVNLFTFEDYKNMEEIDAILEDEYFMEIFSKEIERFDEAYFENV